MNLWTVESIGLDERKPEVQQLVTVMPCYSSIYYLSPDLMIQSFTNRPIYAIFGLLNSANLAL